MKIRVATALAAFALALAVFAAPSFAADVEGSVGLLPAPGAEITADALPTDLMNADTVHLGAGAEADLRLELILQSGGPLGDTEVAGCFTSGWSCGPWYRTGNCCSNPEADQEAQNCSQQYYCPNGSSWTEYRTYTKCVGSICH